MNVAPRSKTNKTVDAYISANFGLTDHLLDLDTTDPAKGYTLREAFADIQKANLAANAIGYERAAEILAKTNWFQTHGVQVTQRLGEEKSKSGAFKEAIDKNLVDVKAQATALGFQLTDKQAKEIARDSYVFGNAYNSNKIIESIASAGKITGGQAVNVVDALKAHSADMGVTYDDKWYTDAARNIAENKSTADDWKRTINDVAKSKYSAFADQIDAGQTVKQVASPYINSMSQILELPPESIALTDPTINKALTNLTTDSKPALQPLWQFETSLRKDPRWASTKNARDAADSATRQILSDFGLVS
jgi:hypothetical protein